jgi:hypothetical protein
MALISRVLVGLIGLLALLGVGPHWFRLQHLPIERGIQALGDAGRANVRADVGGLFLAIALFAFIAAAKQNRTWALAGMLLVGSALVGRIVSLAIDGFGPRVGPPIAIEALVVAIFALAYWSWGKKPEGL